MARSPGFGPAPGYSFRPVKTRFRVGFAFSCVTLHPKAARRCILQKARHHPLTGSDFLQAYGFRFSFTPLARFFSPFPHGTSSLSLTLTAFSCLTLHPKAARRFILQKARHHPLTGSDFLQAYGFRFSFTPLARFYSPFPQGTGSLSLTSDIQPWRMVPPASDRITRVPSYSGFLLAYTLFPVPGFHRLWQYCPLLSGWRVFALCRSYTPAFLRFGLLPVRSPLIGNSLLFSSPPGT